MTAPVICADLIVQRAAFVMAETMWAGDWAALDFAERKDIAREFERPAEALLAARLLADPTVRAS